MNAKIVSIIAICAAVIVAGVSGVVISMNRADAARAAADKAASEEASDRKRVREKEIERARIADERAKAEAEAQREKEAARKAAEEEKSQRIEAENLAAKRKIAADERAKAEAAAQEAADLKATKELELKVEKEKADAERAKAQAAADELARAEAIKAAREAETLKLKISMAELESEKARYVELMAELAAYQRELDERELALHPDKTIADVSWIPGDDLEVDENGRPRPKKKKPYLAENDATLPNETRELAKADRIRAQADEILKNDSRARAIAPLEKLYVAAVKEGRIVDAEYYRVVLKSMYPDWEYKPPSTSGEAAQAPSTNQP